MDHEMVIAQLTEQIAKLLEQQKEITQAIEEKILEIKCIEAETADKI